MLQPVHAGDVIGQIRRDEIHGCWTPRSRSSAPRSDVVRLDWRAHRQAEEAIEFEKLEIDWMSRRSISRRSKASAAGRSDSPGGILHKTALITDENFETLKIARDSLARR